MMEENFCFLVVIQECKVLYYKNMIMDIFID